MRFPAFARCLLSSLVCLTVGGGTATRADTTVFAGGRALMPVYVGAQATADERAAAAELARVLGLMSGLEWPVQTEPEGQSLGFYVGRTAAAGRLLPELKPSHDLFAPRPGEIGPDGIRLRTVGDRVFVEGGTPEATLFAVSWLVQRHGGVRWYWPGTTGEVIPRRERWILPDLAEVHEPAYVSREISGLRGEPGRVWQRHNGLRQRLEYSHNLTRIFPPELHDVHPEWFGLVNGERRRPLGGRDWHWQPDLANPEVAVFAAARAAEALAADPRRASFSLGMNDTVRFDQGEGTRAAVAPLRYFRGMPDYSPLVFGFMNRAVAALPPSLDNRYLGCLAYFWCEDVPPFPVDPRVVPYVTTDRTQFYDPAYRAADFALMSRWQGSGARAYGIWEYGYGTAYVVPRVPHAMLAEAVREGWWRGARGYIADTGPHAGFDAFKVWMLAQLLQEPERSTEALADDFFPGWYGPAAEPMRRFFARCEEVWMAQSGPPWWIKFYQQPDQVLLFPPEVCAELRGLLDEAGRSVGNVNAQASPRSGGVPCPERRAQIEAAVRLTGRAFAVTEAAVAYDAVRRGLGEPAAERLDAAALGARLLELLRARAVLAARLADATSGEMPAMASGNIDWLLRNDPVPRLLLRLGQRDPGAPAAALSQGEAAGVAVPEEWLQLAAACAAGVLRGAPDLAYNGRFLQDAGPRLGPRFLYPTSGDVPEGWEVRATPTEKGQVALGPARAGMRVLRIEGAWDTRVAQMQPARPGRFHLVEGLMRGRSSPGNDVALTLAFVDAQGELLGDNLAVALPKGEGAWRGYALGAVAPAGACHVVFGVAVTRQFGADWAEATALSLRAAD